MDWSNHGGCSIKGNTSINPAQSVSLWGSLYIVIGQGKEKKENKKAQVLNSWAFELTLKRNK